MTDLNPAIDAAASALCVMVDQDEQGRHCDVHEQATGPDARFCGVGEYDATKAVQTAAPVLLARTLQTIQDQSRGESIAASCYPQMSVPYREHLSAAEALDHLAQILRAES